MKNLFVSLGAIPFLSALFFYAEVSEARLQYAALHKMNRCTHCHINPTGGSLRNKTGKTYGQYGFLPGPFSNQDLLSADVRILHYQPEKQEANRGGMGVMAGQIGANVPLMTEKSHGYESRLAYSHNLGGFSTTRSAYLRLKFSQDSETSWLPQYLMVGRFYAPFGALTDEHRTYVRMQNRTSWNDFDTGAQVSANPFDSLHYDIAVVNGQKNAGSLSEDQSTKWGYIANLRWVPAFLPMMAGLSYSEHKMPTSTTAANSEDPKSWAVYGVAPLQQVSSWLPLTVTMEYQESENWNEESENEFVARYVSGAPYKTGIVGKTSKGLLLRTDIHLSQRWSLIYKYDSLLLNDEFTADTFIRDGYGLRWAFGPNSILQFRHETTRGGPPSEPDAARLGKLDAFWVLLQVGV